MKALIKAAVIAFIISVIYSVIPFEAECGEISEDLFRLHILANSDSEDDQSLKLKVRDRVLEYTEEVFAESDSKDSAEKTVSKKLNEIAEIASETIRDNGYTYSVKAELTKMYFNTREYGSYTVPAGMYDALRITIGEGKGHNWWCVMYPSICLFSDEERDEKAREALSENEFHLVKNEKYEYKFKLVEIFEQICAWIG